MINCKCGSNITKGGLSRHQRTKKHMDFIKRNETVREEEQEEQEGEEEEQEEQEEEEQEEQEKTEQVKELGGNQTESDEEEPTPPPPSTNTKYTNSKAHMTVIRQKALQKIREKKQKKIDEENLIKHKAVQYDLLVKSIKQKEEQEAKQKELDKLKEMEYKSNQYDKMVKQQERNKAITSLSNQKVFDDVREHRLNYLMKYLQNPSHMY